MFERYTDAARRAVFFARYEASRSASAHIEPEHLLLGLLREQGRLLQAPTKIEAIEEQIRKELKPGTATSSSVDLPLSGPSKRVLALAEEQARQLKQDRIGPEHLLLGITLEESCTAARILREHGFTFPRLREAAVHEAALAVVARPRTEAAPAAEGLRDLVELAARQGRAPLIGRERELERIIHILSRRTKNNAVLIGEAGVGKTAIVEGLAWRLAEAQVPPMLAERPLMALDASSLAGPRQRPPHMESLLAGLTDPTGTVLFVRGLFNLASAGSAWAVVEAMHALEPLLAHGELQCIATGSPAGLQETREKAGMLARHFEVVPVAPVSEADALRIVSALKTQFEDFHEVTFTAEAVELAVHASGRFLPGRHLPDRAIDLIDEAAAAVKLRRPGEPPEMAEARKRIRQHARALENAIGRHDFEGARHLSEEQRKERAELDRLRAQLHLNDTAHATVTAEDIEAAVAARAGVPVAEVRRVLEQKEPEEVQRIAGELAAQVPAGAGEWLPLLAAYLARCSPAEAATLARAITEAKKPA